MATGLVGGALVRFKLADDWKPAFHHLQAQITSMFWVFTATVGALVFLMLYLSPRFL
jgi:uncharacterized membrane protein YozB (DUF420 family)